MYGYNTWPVTLSGWGGGVAGVNEEVAERKYQDDESLHSTPAIMIVTKQRMIWAEHVTRMAFIQYLPENLAGRNPVHKIAGRI